MKSVIIGAGTYGEVYLVYLQDAGIEVVGFLDDNKDLYGKQMLGCPVLGGTNMLPVLREKCEVEAIYCPIGNNKLRVEFLSQARSLGYETPNFIHKLAFVSPNVRMGNNGVYVLPNTLIMPHVVLDDYVMVSVGANIAHHSHLSLGVFVSTGVNLGASLVAEKYAYIGMGSTVMTGVKVLGENCLIGAGAVVIKDVPANAIVAGVAAKVLRYKQ